MGGQPVLVAHTLTSAYVIYADVGLSLGWLSKKTKLVLPAGCEHGGLLLSRNLRGDPLPDIVQGFKACLGVPYHPAGDEDFILGALQQLAVRHDSLLELVGDVSEENSFATLRLL